MKIHVVCVYYFRLCNFDGRKLHIVSTYFFQCNFDGRKIHVVSTYFFRCNFSSRNIHCVSNFFDAVLMVEKYTLFPRTFFNVIFLVEISTVLLLTFFDVILMVQKSSLTSTFSCQIYVIFSMWICLSHSMKSSWISHAEFWYQIDGDLTKMCPLGSKRMFVFLFDVFNGCS